jgi:hypothetical protein
VSSLLDQRESSRASYKINWKLIEDLMDFVRMDLMNYCLSDNTHKNRVVDNYGLIQFGEVTNYRPAQEDVKMREEGSKSESED